MKRDRARLDFLKKTSPSRKLEGGGGKEKAQRREILVEASHNRDQKRRLSEIRRSGGKIGIKKVKGGGKSEKGERSLKNTCVTERSAHTGAYASLGSEDRRNQGRKKPRRRKRGSQKGGVEKMRASTFGGERFKQLMGRMIEQKRLREREDQQRKGSPEGGPGGGKPGGRERKEP